MTVTFELPDPGLSEHTWVYSDEHNPACHPPLTASLGGMDFGGGGSVPGSIHVNGYSFMRIPFSLPQRTFEGAGLAPLARWRNVWRPWVDRYVGSLLSFDPATVRPGQWRETLDAANTEMIQIMVAVHATSVFGVNDAAARFIDAYTGHLGAARDGEALALLHGFENATTSRAIAIWELSRLVAGRANLRQAIEAWRPGDPIPAIDGFEEALRALTERCGLTTDALRLDAPTWREDPSPVMAAVRQQLDLPEDQSPRARQEQARTVRAGLEAELRRAATTNEAAAVALAALPAAQELLVVKEDHNVLCDQALAAASRLRWLAIGRRLRGQRRLTAPDDVFFYTFDELVRALEGEAGVPRHEIAGRRARQERFRAATPPRFLGQPPAGITPAAAAVVAPVIRGIGAAPGVYVGRVRLALSLGEAATIEPGEVLVCPVTAPAWTPFFGIAGAVVTDVGGLLSHPAIVAREFGIPGVTGCRDVTARLRDGMLVEVDGRAGTVTPAGS